MNMKNRTLDLLTVGEKGIVKNIRNQGSIRRRLLDIGLVPGTEVECVLKSPPNDPKAYFIRGALIAIRKKDASEIELEGEL